ncbi:MAM and LDL-receptor class A domain-containing protein 1-like isoform X2 [Homarus americanus]|uniref:MAM and LDL-receptor class A domain-containing protein 1-like isoform X2 n=1 Tax=Homarus americanus TaxID=6706 RepID=UPI001C450595|nr:MAM and LDL-receptor class A domain-containing protein 1-like isoform X2 [Homarus americanus]
MRSLLTLVTAALVVSCLAGPHTLLQQDTGGGNSLHPVEAEGVVEVENTVLVRTKRQEEQPETVGEETIPDEPQPPPPAAPEQPPPPAAPEQPPPPVVPEQPSPPAAPEQPPPPAAPEQPPPPVVPEQPPPQPPPQPRPPPRRQRPAGTNTGGPGAQQGGEESTPELCDFDSSPNENLCDWTNLKVTQLQWQASVGKNTFWLGGPKEDVSYGDDLGGYAMFETSQIPQRNTGQPTFESAMLMSPVKESTGPAGVCVKFWYSIAGLSPDRLRVLLHTLADNTSLTDPVDQMMVGYDGSEDVVLWEARDMTMGEWKEGQVVYTFDKKHSVIFEGIPVDSSALSRRFRGYIALDELTFAESSQCGAFCTFEGGTCGWTQDANDDFDWTQSRGSLNPSTGPPRDRSSFANDGKMGGYAFINSGYPRRPGDRARLMSQEFQGTNPDSPLCMRFWTHMFGNGIGTLRVIIYDVNTAKDKVIWQISGEAGNAWYQGQVPIASPSPFKIVFEGEVGQNNLGDIAIDDISIVQGPCPSAPQVAADKSGDCTFEVDECGWNSPGPRERLDEIDWVRTVAADNRSPTRDHTIGTLQGSAAHSATAQDHGFYMTLPRGTVQRGGDRSWLVSNTMKGSDDPMCVAFWYFMYEPFIDPSGPSLGSLLVYTRYENEDGEFVLQPVWSLKNHQGPNWMYGQAKVQNKNDYTVVFEGVWGSSRGNGFMALDDITLFAGGCSTKPAKAMTTGGDCDFQRDACLWKNVTTDSDFRWTTASISRRPANLPDHTFSGPIGYAYFDVFNQNARPQSLGLHSPPMDKSADNSPICLTFWYAYFGASESTILKISREPYNKEVAEGERVGEPVELWVLEASNIGTRRPEWQFGQVEVDASSDYRVSIVGMASNGGFAIDDIKTYMGSCGIRPAEANPTTTTAAEQPAATEV